MLVCNLCGSTEHRLLYHSTMHRSADTAAAADRFSQYAFHGDIYRCTRCGLVQQRLEHTPQEIVQLLRQERYLDEAIGQLNQREKGRFFRRLIAHMQGLCELQGARILDIGTNTGVFLEQCRPFSQHLAGVEPSAEAAAECRRKGLDVQSCPLIDADLPRDHFDIITLWDVIEHLWDPSGDLGRVVPLLRPGGMLFISTHDIDGLFARLTGSRYPMLMYQHFYHFSKTTLSSMLEQAGLRPLDVRYFSKSWSLQYLRELMSKLWPDRLWSRIGQGLLGAVLRIGPLHAIQVVVPIRNFFVLAARRPGP